MEANSEAIVRLAWARALGLPDDALAAPGSRVIATLPAAGPQDGGVLRALSLFDSTALVGPEWMVERVGADFPLAAGDPIPLAGLGPGARVLAHEALGYRDDYPHQDHPLEDHPRAPSRPGAEDPADEGPLVSHDPADLESLVALCPQDDVNDAGLRGLDTAFTMLDDDHRPLAAAAYRVEHGMLADVRALTAPGLRRRGHAALLAGLLIEDALDAGLIAQGRHDPASIAGARLAAALGLRAAGALVVLGAGAAGQV